MGCGASQPVQASGGGTYTTDKPKPPQSNKDLSRNGAHRESSDSLKSFSDSALNVKLSSDKNLVLVWDGELPSKNAYYEQAAMVLKIKGIEYTEEIVAVSNAPAWFKSLTEPSLPFLVWRDRSTKEVSPAGRPDVKGLFKFVEDHVKHPRLFIPSCMDDTRNLGRQGLNQLDGDLHALLSMESPLSVTKLRESIITCLGVIDHSIAEKKWVGPYMFGTSISVVDVIYAPLFVRLEAAVQTRGLEIPDTLPNFTRYRDDMMATDTVKSMVISLDTIIRHYERLAQRSAMSLPCFALQDKAISRHFKSCVSAAEAAVAGREGALLKLTHKFNRLETLVVSKGAMMTYVVPSIMGQLEPDTAQVKLHVDTIEEFEKLRGQLTAVAKSSPEEQVRACQEFLAAVKTFLDTQSTVRTQALDAVVQLYRQVSPELRWGAQRVFYGGAARLKAVYDPWLDLTPYIIEGLTAEETELYVWEAHLATLLDNDPNNSAFKTFLGAISAAATRGVINDAAWQVIQGRILRHVKHAVPLVLTASRSINRSQSANRSRRQSDAAASTMKAAQSNVRESRDRSSSAAVDEY